MPTLHAYQEFLAQRKADLRRIANTTRREVELKDVEQEVWIVAELLEERWGCFFDFTVPANQEYLIGWLHNEFVKFTEKTNRYAASIDQDDEDSWNAGNFGSRLNLALADSDPLITLQSQEEEMQREISKALIFSYSEAVAYALLLNRFMGDVSKLANFLQVVLATLHKRIDRAIELLNVQPTLFDGIEIIDPEFIAKQEKHYIKRESEIFVEQQVLWES